MLLSLFLNHFVKVGTLHLIDSREKHHVFLGTASPILTLRLHSKSIERRLFFSPEMALGEGYMNGELSLEGGDIHDFLCFCALNYEKGLPFSFQKILSRFEALRRLFHPKNDLPQSHDNVAHHYNLSEILYRLFLDKDMQYSCGYFKKGTDSLGLAQRNKKIHLATKLQLKPGQKVLDIGSGWGGLAITLAQVAGVDVTGLTLSEEQHRVATRRAKDAGLQDQVRFYLRDYRQEREQYDRIVSVGMFEHVGIKHYDEFFSRLSSLLKEDGLALLHFIGSTGERSTPNSWINKYIFPGGYCPSLSEVLQPIETSELFVTDIEVLHLHYAQTLRHWRTRFLAHKGEIQKKWGSHFYRMWDYYLALSETGFRIKNRLVVFQIQLMKNIECVPLTRGYMYPYKKRRKELSLTPNTSLDIGKVGCLNLVIGFSN